MKTVNVVAAIIQRGGEVLATERGYGEFAGGWEFPGGKVEPGEQPAEALVREIHEELDASIAVERHVCTVDYDYATFHLHMQCFLCHLTSDFTLLEHHAARWVDGASIDDVAWLPADTTVIDAIKQQGIV